jgi:lipoyl(octanoyl) transferase
MLLSSVRYIPFSPSTPYENMAIDEYLSELAAKNNGASLRTYGWVPAGISIGKYQDPGDINLKECGRDKVPVVRRITGGGAIFHDRELTYCFAIPEKFFDGKTGVKEAFEKINVFLIKMYSKFGLQASFARDAFPGQKQGERAAFCFSANEEYDIIINNKKIGGNAQARKKGVIFQHGSIPLEASGSIEKYFSAPYDTSGFTNLSELAGRPVDAVETEANLVAAFTETLGVDLKPAGFELGEKKRIVELVTGKYARNEWNVGK